MVRWNEVANSYHLTVAGGELPDDVAQQNMPGLGVPRVRLQVEQLGGMLTTERTPLGILFASTFRTCTRRTAPAHAGSGRAAPARPERPGPLNRLQHGLGAAKLAAQAQGGVRVAAHLAGPALRRSEGTPTDAAAHGPGRNRHVRVGSYHSDRGRRKPRPGNPVTTLASGWPSHSTGPLWRACAANIRSGRSPHTHIAHRCRCRSTGAVGRPDADAPTRASGFVPISGWARATVTRPRA